MKSKFKNGLFVMGIALALSYAPFGAAQPTDSSTGANTQGSASAPTKAERKAARKQARAKKNAELKKLEDAGYNPAARDETYPNNIQKAEKKAGMEAKPAQ